MVLGMIWYGPLLFGKTWMKIIGVDPATMPPEKIKEMQKKAMLLYGLQFGITIISLYIFTYYTVLWQTMMGEMGAWSGIQNALWIWLGFIMPIQAGNAMWSGKPKNLAWIMFFTTAGYQLAAFIIFGAIIGGWN